MQNGEENKAVRISDEQWDAVERLIPLLGKEHEWEVSTNRHHERCLWEREEDAPFWPDEALRALRGALTKPLKDYALSAEDVRLLEPLFLGD
ncbi:MAG: hypothetical protein K6G16_08720 [Lachnospiraceae bacterium]|nr:hypothetical protein [Lachnospiraceae bacterium]